MASFHEDAMDHLRTINAELQLTDAEASALLKEVKRWADATKDRNATHQAVTVVKGWRVRVVKENGMVVAVECHHHN